MAQVISLGRVNCSTSPVQVSASPQRCSKIIVSAIAGMTGKLYFGVAGISKTTLAGVVKEFIPTVLAAGVQDVFVLDTGENKNQFLLSDFWIDGAVSGEGLIIAYVVS